MPKPMHWGGLPIGASQAEVLYQFPDGRASGKEVATAVVLHESDFEIILTFGDEGLSKAAVSLVRLRSLLFGELQQYVLTDLTDRYGKGLRRVEHGGVLKKQWRQPWVRIELVASDDD